jgi:flagellar hook-basal body complex protein FliE
MSPISPIRHVSNTIAAPALGGRSAPGGGDFGAALASSIQAVQNAGTSAAQSAERFLSGEGEELHQVALAMQKAELAFDLFLEVRNKVVSAYQEVMRMQL